MDKIKKCLSLVLMALCCAYTIDGISQETKESKQMIIIKKTVDDNGNETVEKKVYEGDDLADVDVDKLMTEDINGDMDIWISSDGETHDLTDEDHDLMIFTADDELIDAFLNEQNLSKEDIEKIDINVESSIENGIETESRTMTIVDKNGKKYSTDVTGMGKEVRTKGPIMKFDYVPSKPKLGVMVENNDRGAEIIEVIPNSPAATAGLQVGDVIYGLGETPINNTEDLIANLKELEDKVYIAYYRDGNAGGMWVTLAPFEFKSNTKETRKERIIMKN